jgi:hypothetical protein
MVIYGSRLLTARMLSNPPTTQPLLPRTTIIDQTVDLGSGQEWDFPAQRLVPGVRYEIAWVGTVRAYVGLFPEASYAHFRGIRAPAPFRFGSDQQMGARVLQIPTEGVYHLVARVGVFTPPGRVRVGLYNV